MQRTRRVGSSTQGLPATTPVGGTAVRRPLVVVAIAVAVGILLDRYSGSWWAGEGLLAWWLVAAVALLTWGWFVYRGKGHRGEREGKTSLLLLLTIASLAAAWHHGCWYRFQVNDLGRMASEEPQPCAVTAIALASPERVAVPEWSAFHSIPVMEQSRLPLRITGLRNGPHWQGATGRCRLTVDGHLLGVHRGDRLLIFCQLRAPSPPRNPGQFDFAAHARASRQLCTLRAETPACVTVLQSASGWQPLRAIDRLRAAWQQRLWSLLGPERAPLAAAILLGARHAMPRENSMPFLVTGTMHVLVVSGLHAGMLISSLFLLLRIGLLPRRGALALAMLLILLYALLTGAHPPVVRAAVLGEIACLALWWGRNPLAANSLAAAAILVLLWNPAELLRPGTQLSFLCAGTLLWFSQVRWRQPPTPLQELLFHARPRWYRATYHWGISTGRLLGASLALWVVALPLLMYRYHLVTPMGVLISPLLLLTVTALLATGFLLLAGGWLLPLVEPPLAQLCGDMVTLLERLVTWASNVEGAYHWTPGPPLWWVVGSYLLLALLLRPAGVAGGWRRSLQVAAIWVLVGCLPAIVNRSQKKPFEATFLDVGHGTSVVVTTPGGRTLLYDAGSMGSPQFASETIANYLWWRGIRSIDGLVLSHADVDHFNAVPGLVERFPIGAVYVSPMMFPRRLQPTDQSAPAELRRLLSRHRIPVQQVVMGDRLLLDESTTAEVLYPDRMGNFAGDNANSLVLAVECEGYRLLLPGDLEAAGLEALIADEPYDCDLLMAPHHGSRRSDPPGFAAWSRPEWVVISCGHQGSGHHRGEGEVAANYRQQGATLFTTHHDGAIEVKLAGPHVLIHPFLR